MAVSKLIASSGANDFNLNITGATTVATFDKEYASGSYSIVSSGNDATIDIYSYNAAGTMVGYTGTKAFTASGGFIKMVIIGGTPGDVLGFTYKKTITTTAATAEVTAGPVAISLTPTALPSINDSSVLTGANFATDVQVFFSASGYSSTAAKSVVRSSPTSLIVTRPDSFPASTTYTVTVNNPGVTAPTGSNAHILANSVTSGTNPAWTTPADAAFFVTGQAYTYTLSASDTEASAIQYTIISGTLPAGLSLNASTGVVSGTPSGSTSQSLVFRATDTGGNFVNRTVNFPVLTWTANGSINAAGALSLQLTPVITTGATLAYTVVTGALPSGISLSGTGLLTGTPVGSGTVTPAFRVTDGRGGTFTRSATTFAFRSQAAGTTFSYSAAPSFWLVGDVISSFPVGSTAFSSFLNATTVDFTAYGGGGARTQVQAGTSGNGGSGGLGVGRFATGAAGLNSSCTVLVGGGGTAGTGNQGAGGGGYTGLRRSDSTFVMISGGGGAGGGSEGGGQTGGTGGNGGGPNQNGVAGTTASSGANGGGAGTTGGGGSGGAGNYAAGTSGGSLQGGNGGNVSGTAAGGTNGGGGGGSGYGGGGGGGGGLFGGGGGGNQSTSSAGGGGGSGQFNTSYGSLISATAGGAGNGATTNYTNGGIGSAQFTIVAVA